MTNPFTAKAKKHKLRKFGGTKKQEPASTNGKVQNPWIKKLEVKRERETRGILHPGSEKADFVRNGIRYSNCRDHGGWWSVDVTTGDITLTFHTRFGSWMTDVDGEGRMREATREVAFACNDRYLTELKRIGAELPFYLRSERIKRDTERKAKDEPAPDPAPKKGKGKGKGKRVPA